MGDFVTIGYNSHLNKAILSTGLRPLCISAKDKPGLELVDNIRVADVEDGQAVLRELLRYRDSQQFSGVGTARDDGVFTASLLRASFGLPGDTGYVKSLYFRDKHLQKRELPGAMRADFQLSTRCTSFNELAKKIGLPFVVKPLNGHSSERTQIVSNCREYDQYLSSSASPQAFFCERYIDGQEYAVTGFWNGEQLEWISIIRFTVPPIEWTLGNTVSFVAIPPEQEPETYARIETFSQLCFATLRMPAAFFHLECFESGLNLKFSECAIRPSGGIIPLVIDHMYGIDLYREYVLFCTGKQPLFKANTGSTYWGGAYLRANNHVHVNPVDIEREFAPEILDYPKKRTGEKHLYGRVGHVVLRGTDQNHVVEQLQRLIDFTEGRCV